MNRCRHKSYSEQVKLRVRILWIIFAGMLAYMVIVGMIGLGDSRKMTRLATAVSRIIFFGGMGVVIAKIVRSNKMLANQRLLWEEEKSKKEERDRFLHDKSGGLVVDVLILAMLFVTCTVALWNMPAFYVSLGLLLFTALLKAVSYAVYNRKY